MRGRGPRNPAFFARGAAEREGLRALSFVFRAARVSGKADISSRKLQQIPVEVFDLFSYADEDEKFWEMSPLSRLDVSHNHIAEVASGQFPKIASDLEVLKLRDNVLSELPPDLFTCNRLKLLDVSSNKLHTLPTEIGFLSEVSDLYMADNMLSTLPLSLTSCQNLQHLELQRNQIRSLQMETFHGLTLLKHLDLSSNRLVELPRSLSNVISIEFLEISSNALRSIPDLSILKDLLFLDASNNHLTSVPVLPSSGKLDRLYLRENQLVSLSTELLARVSTSLSELLVQGNQIAACPDEICCLGQLKVLDMSNNNLTTLPHTLGYMAHLSKLLVEGNPIRVIRRSLLSSPRADDLKAYLRTRGPPPNSSPLIEGSIKASSSSPASATFQKHPGDNYKDNVNEDGLHAGVPGDDLLSEEKNEEILSQIQWRVRDSVGGVLDVTGLKLNTRSFQLVFHQVERSHLFNSLVSLTLSDNCLDTVPHALHHLQGLRRLDISRNQLGARCIASSNRGAIQKQPIKAKNEQEACTSCDQSVCGALPRNLNIIDVSSNKLTTEELDALLQGSESLVELLASSNCITRLPHNIHNHFKLRILQFGQNQISSLTDANFHLLNSLEVLDFSNNQLDQIDCSFPPTLSTLVLVNNNIKELPPELALLTNLRTLSLTGNPLRTIRHHVLAQGAEAVLAVLRNRLPSQQSLSKETAPPLSSGRDNTVQSDSHNIAGRETVVSSMDDSKGMIVRGDLRGRRGVDDAVVSTARRDSSASHLHSIEKRVGERAVFKAPISAAPRAAVRDRQVDYQTVQGDYDHSQRGVTSQEEGQEYRPAAMPRGSGSEIVPPVNSRRSGIPMMPSRRPLGGGETVTPTIATSAGYSASAEDSSLSRARLSEGDNSSLIISRSARLVSTESTGGRGGTRDRSDKLPGGPPQDSGRNLQELLRDMTVLENELEGCTNNLRRVELRKAVAVKRANILRLQSSSS